jgi:hypothetical protein
MDVSGWVVEFYNGSSSQLKEYMTVSLDTATVTSDGTYDYYVMFKSGIQNGAPDGFALVDSEGGCIEFLSYEGSFTAAEDACAGITSTDIGVFEGSGSEDESLQLQDGAWVGPVASTWGS